MITVLFDDVLRTRKGKLIPYYDTTYVKNAKDKELVWFHEGYGVMKLYRLWKVDDKNYIAEDLHKCCSTSNQKWKMFLNNPEMALNN